MSVSGASSSAKWPAFSSSRTGPLGKAARKCVKGIFDEWPGREFLCLAWRALS